MKTRTKTVSDLAQHLGCKGYLTSLSVRDYRASVLDGDGVYWLTIEDQTGVTAFLPHPTAIEALSELSLFIESKQEHN